MGIRDSQYTEKAMRRRVHKLKHQAHKRGGIDLLLTLSLIHI